MIYFSILSYFSSVLHQFLVIAHCFTFFCKGFLSFFSFSFHEVLPITLKLNAIHHHMHLCTFIEINKKRFNFGVFFVTCSFVFNLQNQ